MSADEQRTAALSRLTANEKECLRRRLLPQTAKEMALDLGISPHAVEKRLKMARTKLGMSSSLAAARLLAAAERYQPLVPELSDLSHAVQGADSDTAAAPFSQGKPRLSLSEGLTMIVLLCLAALVAQDVPAAAGTAAAPTTEHLGDRATRKVGMDEAAAFIRPGFLDKDKDRSGFLDARELSALEPRNRDRDPSLPAAPPPGAPDPAAAAKWMGKMDTNRDNKVSEQEYVSYMMPWILWQGVPADWHAAP
jgi:DNA-binding CsgD family transcriptional regulator